MGAEALRHPPQPVSRGAVSGRGQRSCARPARLFAAPPYRETGAIFWPDIKPIPADSPIWEICRVPYRDEPSFESGQIVLDKARCWKARPLTMHMNERADFYYQHVLGDKDTFHMAWRFLAQPYSMAPYPPQLIEAAEGRTCWTAILGPVLGQRDFDGRVILQHRNWPKFILFGINLRYPGVCARRGVPGVPRRIWVGYGMGGWRHLNYGSWRSNGSNPAARGRFCYVRVSDDERLLDSCPINGSATAVRIGKEGGG